MTLPKIIGICGYGGSGKDTIAGILRDDYQFVQIAFADKVRDTLYHLNPFLPDANLYYCELIDTIGYDTAKRRYESIRKWLVKIGHGMRLTIDDSIWIRAANLSEKMTGNIGGIVVSDVRYANEATAIKELGGEIWYVFRPGVDAASPEEKDSIRMVKFDQIITNSGTIDDLRNCIKNHHAF